MIREQDHLRGEASQWLDMYFFRIQILFLIVQNCTVLFFYSFDVEVAYVSLRDLATYWLEVVVHM